jgi:uncharacterized membrane protein
MAPDRTSPTTRDSDDRDQSSAYRLASLDALRGLIIVLMAIDHARGFIARNHPGEFWGSPLPDYQGDWVAFLTRLVTHLCAPGFMFLMGAGAALFATSRARAGWSPVRIAGQLALRGLVLVLVGQLLENTAAAFGSAGATRAVSYGLRVPGAPGPIPLILGVLYGLGSALVVAAALVRLRPWALVLLSGACVAATHTLTPDASHVGEAISPLLGMLVVPGFASPLLSIYPTMPWLAPTLLGVAFGRALERDRRRAFSRIAIAGVVGLALFVGLRASGGVGSFQPIEPGWIGFLNVTKYPPSLTFLLLTLGANFVLLGWLEFSGAGAARWMAPLRVYGSVPLFFFVTHLWLYGAMGRLFPAGMTIPRMYPFWLLGLALLYLPCRWYGEFKGRRPSNSLLRLF